MAREAEIKITVDSDQARRKLDQLDRSLKKTDTQSKKTSKSMLAMGKSMAKGALAIAAVVAVVVVFIKRQLDMADKLSKTADKIGISIEKLQELRFAAEQSGVAVTAFDVGLQRFGRRVGEVDAGVGVLKKEFDKLGISVRDQDGNLKPLEKTFGEYADAIMNTESQQEQLRLAFAAFDTEGAALVNLMRTGAIGVDEFGRKLHELGGVMSGDAARGAAELNDGINELTKKFVDAPINAGLEALINKLRDVGLLGPRTFEWIKTTGDVDAELEKINQQLAVTEATLTGEKSLWDSATQGIIDYVGVVNPLLNVLTESTEETEQRNARLLEEKGILEARRVLLEDQVKATQLLNQADRALLENLININPQQKAFDEGLRVLDDALKLNEIDATLYAQALLLLKENTGKAISETEKLAEKEALFADFFPIMTARLEGEEKIRRARELGILTAEQEIQKTAELETALAKMGDSAQTNQEKWEQSLAESADSALAFATAMQNGINDAAGGMADSFVEFARTGEMSFGDLAESILADFAKMIIQAQIFAAIQAGLSAAGFSLPVSPNAKGNAFAGGNVIPFAKGGVVDSPTLFPMANGAGLMGEAGPEAVIPLSRGAGGKLGVNASGMGGGGVTVNVINETSDEVDVKTSSDGMTIDILIAQSVNKGLNSGSFDKTLGNSFGLSRKGR